MRPRRKGDPRALSGGRGAPKRVLVAGLPPVGPASDEGSGTAQVRGHATPELLISECPLSELPPVGAPGTRKGTCAHVPTAVLLASWDGRVLTIPRTALRKGGH